MKGHCLCHAVVLETEDRKEFTACHCGMCRRWGGGPLLCLESPTQVRIEGLENVATYRSSEWAERGFCRVCGTHLFYKFLPADGYILPIGLFQDGVEFEMKEQIFSDRKPGYYDFSNDTPQLSEAEVFEKFGNAQ